MAVDVTVVSAVQLDTLANAARQRGAAAQHRAQLKINKYAADLRERADFSPFVIESYGHIGIHAVGIIDDLARRIARAQDLERSIVLQSIYIELSILVQSHNAVALLNRIPRPVR